MTNDQKQCLLRYLGYYDDDVDGIWGANSKSATKAFQRDNKLKESGNFDTAAQNAAKAHIAAGTGFKKATSSGTKTVWWKDIKYFARDEFKCKCGGKYCKGFYAEPQEKLVRLLDEMRENLGVPIIIVSGVRCTKHNANVGGVASSRHLSGKAVDIKAKGKTADQVLAEVKRHPEARYAYKINSTNVHVDIA